MEALFGSVNASVRPVHIFGVCSSELCSGIVRSCGCSPKTKHKVLEDQYSPENIRLYLYKIWYHTCLRCGDHKNMKRNNVPKIYETYDIHVCAEWLDFENFYNWALSTGYKAGSRLRRKDLLGNFSPENCYWIEYSRYRRRKEQ